MKDWLILIASIVSGLLTYFFTRKKNKAETKLTEVEVAQRVVDLYKDALSEVQAELAKAREEIAKSREEIAKLREEVEKLTKLNRKLDNELKYFRKSQNTTNGD
jgi:septal ring factor EnvC (AmiA/AmiB activator)